MVFGERSRRRPDAAARKSVCGSGLRLPGCFLLVMTITHERLLPALISTAGENVS